MVNKSLQFKILGLNASKLFLTKKVVSVKTGVSSAMRKISLYMEGEIKESIAGHKAETRSVDTGNFLNNIKSKHNSTSATIQDNTGYGAYLEYGTSRIPERRHFRNSLARNKSKIKDYLNSQIKKSI